MSNFLINLIKVVLTQIFGILGIFFIFGFLLGKIQEATHHNYRRMVGWKGIIWTAWIGTPIHELSHAIMAKIFGHKITEFAIFRPNEETGGLGYVNHTYNRFNPYQRIGNFPIAIAPLFFGSIFLIFLLYLLVPNSKEIFAPIANNIGFSEVFFNSFKDAIINFFSPENLHSWNFWIFLYISFCVASHIGISKADRRGMWDGFFWMTFLIIIINAIFLFWQVDITKYVLKINQYLGIFIAIFLYAILISFCHFILSFLMRKIFRK